jgi:hypothetical protein
MRVISIGYCITENLSGRQQKIIRGVNSFKEENPGGGDPVKDRDWVDRHRTGVVIKPKYYTLNS